MLLRCLDTADTAPDPLRLACRRVHEASGPARRIFALIQAARMAGPVFWVLPAHSRHDLLLWGLPAGLTPRLHLLRAADEIELLWATEEALRCQTTAIVVAEPDKPLSFTAGRRLQLAAEAGDSTGLMLIGDNGGSNATETSWHCTPEPVVDDRDGDSTRQVWTLKKNKKGTYGCWVLDWDGKTHSLRVVSASGERSGRSGSAV